MISDIKPAADHPRTANRDTPRPARQAWVWHWSLPLLLALPLAATAQTASPFEAIQRLVTDGQYEAAYKLGKRMPDRQGDAHFDFLFGVAAINIGKVPEGVLALGERLDPLRNLVDFSVSYTAAPSKKTPRTPASPDETQRY